MKLFKILSPYVSYIAAMLLLHYFPKETFSFAVCLALIIIATIEINLGYILYRLNDNE